MGLELLLELARINASIRNTPGPELASGYTLDSIEYRTQYTSLGTFSFPRTWRTAPALLWKGRLSDVASRSTLNHLRAGFKTSLEDFHNRFHTLRSHIQGRRILLFYLHTVAAGRINHRNDNSC